MSTQTTEKAFETYVEQILLAKGWQHGSVSEWDQQRALFPSQIVAYTAATQPQLWEAMRGQHGVQLESMLLATLVKELAIKGSLYMLRHGFKFYGKTFRLAVDGDVCGQTAGWCAGGADPVAPQPHGAG